MTDEDSEEGRARLRERAAALEITSVDPDGPLAAAAMRRYVEELDARLPGGFDPGPLRPPDVVLVVTDPGQPHPGDPVACGGLQEIAPGVGEVKRVWVDDAWRGAGLASRVVDHLEGLARERGHRLVRLDTHRVLVEAIALYERRGYRHVERYNDNPYAQVFLEKALPSLG